MARLLLVGNSVNRLGDGPSWAGVVTTLAGAAGLGHDFSLGGKPLPIVYEHIVCRDGCDENDLKRKLAKSMASLESNWSHDRALRLASSNLLTTNYDYCFEQSSGVSRKQAHLDRENTYSAYRRTQVGDRFVWHIHGELDAPRTILLGFHQYTGYVQKLRGYLTTTNKKSPFLKGIADFDRSDGPFSWVDLFLRDDVHIAGLTLDYVELHLWWLIAYKLRLASQGMLCGSTHFYHFGGTGEAADIAPRLGMLQDLNVTVHDIRVRKDDWASAHREAFDQIEAAQPPLAAVGG